VLKTIRRFALVVSCGAVLTALFSLSAQAASSPSTATTLPATNVGTHTATLNAKINTRGQKTAWQFYYGKTKRYGFSTKLQTIPAGKGTVRVSWTVRGLRAKTFYHFTIVTYTGIGTHYVEKYKDHDRSFKTRRKGYRPPQKHHVKAAVTTRPGFTG
jgi:hypothetical protein